MYATVAHMIERFGERDMTRLSRPNDHAATVPDAAKVEVALSDATALINDYLRGRYLLPLTAPPESVVRSTCVLARYDLAHASTVEPTEQMRLARKEVIAWLGEIAAGRITLDQPGEGGGGRTSGARSSDRGRPFSDAELRSW